jgi:hypothetical protein
VNASRLLIITLLGSTLLFSARPAPGGLANTPVEMTLARFRQVPCLEEQQYDYYKDIIRALSYTRMRAFRAFCLLPVITADEAVEALQKLVFYPLGFDQVEILETFFELETATFSQGWSVLEKTAELTFSAGQAAAEMKRLSGLDPDAFLFILDTLGTLDDSGCWAAQALFKAESSSGPDIVRGLSIISKMSGRQHLAAERLSALFNKEPHRIPELLESLQQLSDTDANTVAALFSLEQVTPRIGSSWLQDYFTRLPVDRDRQFAELSETQRSLLLSAYSGGSDYLIWKLNNLHSVTDDYGAEIGTGTLAASSDEQLLEIFEKLHPSARQRHEAALRTALTTRQRYEAVSILKDATAQARRAAARDLSTATIYILLSHGSELYDSSFRDILVPVLLERIKQMYGGNLLFFLTQTDPENGYISDFIVSCAQKGKLTAFFPTDPAEQRNILDLVTSSAFRDEQSLILFSATFSTLLEKIEPDVRSYLIEKIISTIQQPDSAFALQLRVILQYYRLEHPDLLSRGDLENITEVISRYGEIDLSPFVTTDFSRWKADRRLASLSVFQHDDDGNVSYRSNSRNLIMNGYKPRLSRLLTLLPEDDPHQLEAGRLIERAEQKPDGVIGELFALSTRAPVIVEWYKVVNNIELSHALAVYQNDVSQQLLLSLFLEARMEMFAQRGHSYWRGEQLIEPMKKIIEAGAVSSDSMSAVNRFLSIGSCGGLRIYTQLNRLFNNSIDILATIGTGKAVVNDPYNRKLFEIIATTPDNVGWKEINRRAASIFADGRGADYLQPGSLPAILHKMMDTRNLN